MLYFISLFIRYPIGFDHVKTLIGQPLIKSIFNPGLRNASHLNEG